MVMAASALLFRVILNHSSQVPAAGSPYRECLNHMIADYIGSQAGMETLRSADTIGCLGWTTDQRLLQPLCYLRGSSVQQEVLLAAFPVFPFTFITMNQYWITNNYRIPSADKVTSILSAIIFSSCQHLLNILVAT